MSDLARLRMRERGTIAIASIDGEIDVSNSARLLSRLTEAVGNAVTGVLLDLSDLDFLDSSGVHMLYELSDRLANRQQRFAVVIPAGGTPRRALELSGRAADWLHPDSSSGLAALSD